MHTARQRKSTLFRRLQQITKISIWLLIAQLGILTAAAPALHGLFGCANHSHTHHHTAGCDHSHNHSHSHTNSHTNSHNGGERPQDLTGWKATEIRDFHDCLICRFLQTPVDVENGPGAVTVLDFAEMADKSSLAFPNRWREFERARGPPRIL